MNTPPPAAAGTAPALSGPVPAIHMRDITVGALRDQKIIVAEGVNWRVEPGEFWAIAGLHGAGKSDFLMFAGGAMAPLNGTYEFLGEGMPIFSEERLAHRLKLGLVFEGGRLFDQLTLAENIALPLRYHRNLTDAEAEPTVGALLELTGLMPFARSRPAALGRNWQLRAALARALALKPEVLLLDTPMAGMDQRHQGWWLGFLTQLSRGHAFYGGTPITLAVTTSNLRDWWGRANRFALLEGRRFTVLGDGSDVERSRNPLVQELLAPATVTANI